MTLLEATKPEPTARAGAPPSVSRSGVSPPASSLGRIGAYATALLTVALCTAIALAAKPYALLEDEEMIYLLGVLLIALRFDTKVSVLSAILSVLSFAFFFLPPKFALAWSDTKRTLTFLAMIVVAAVVSGLNERLRDQEKLARRHALTREALYRLNVELGGAGQPRQLVAIAARNIDRLFDSSSLIVLRAQDGHLERAPAGLTPEETELMERAWTRNEFSATPERVPGYAIWIPLTGIHESLGVLGLKVRELFGKDSEQGLLFSACARELVTALERTHLATAVRRSQVEAETERMRSSLLSAVSHDLKTPLANMVAAGTTLLAHRKDLEPGTMDELLSSIVGEGERLSRLVQNLLSITRLESPTIELKRDLEAVEEIVAAALERLRPQLDGREVILDIPSDLPWVMVEPALIEQVFSNLLENAMRYAPGTSAITVSARLADSNVEVQVADRGPGIAEQEQDKVFEKFYRGPQAHRNDGGVGLGLTICRAVIRAHGCKIAIRGRSGGGAVVEFTLPLARAPQAAALRKSDEAR